MRFLLILTTGFLCCHIAAGQGIEITATGTIECTGTAGIQIANGNLINNGTYTMGQETVVFSGNTNGTISGSSNTEIYNLTINNTNSVTLSTTGYVAVVNNLTFTSGILSSGLRTFIMRDNATVTGAGLSGYIDGNCRKEGNDAFVFPVGNAGRYAPISISAPLLVTDHFTASFYNANPNTSYDVNLIDAGIDHVSTNEYWMLDRTNGTSNVDVTLTWDELSMVNVMSDLLVVRWDGAKWVSAGNTAVTGTNVSGSITSGTVSSFSPFTLGSATIQNPLPVSLLSFSARPENKSVYLEWSTLSESNCAFYEIEKSNDLVHYLKTDFVPGAGNSNSQLFYESRDTEPYTGVSYYRLRQTDFNGNTTLSQPVSVKFEKNEKMEATCFPNPTTSKNINIDVCSSQSEKCMISLINSQGLIVHSEEHTITEGNNKIRLSVKNASPAGMYILSLTTDQNCIVLKIELTE